MSLTSQKLQQLKQTLSKYPIDNPAYIYTIGNKQSSSSFFSNQRILYIDLKLKTINYANLGKDEPFVNGNIPDNKASISLSSGTFKYLRVKQKEPTIKLWEDKSVDQSSKKLQQWKFQLYSLDVLLQLINIINYVYNTHRSSKQNLQKSDVMQVQPPKNNNLAVEQQQLRNATVYTPSSQQNIVSNVQSPIHKLQDLENNNGKFKFSNALEKNNANKGNQRIVQSRRFDNDEDDNFKFNSLQMSEKNRIKGSNLSVPEHADKVQDNANKQIRYPTSKQQQSYYDPNANQIKRQKSQKNLTIIPPLNMEKLQQTKSFKKYNQEQENNSFSKINTENILNGLSKTENKPPSIIDNGEGMNRSKHRQKNPLQIEISSIEFHQDKEKQEDDDYEDFRGVDIDGQESIQQQNHRNNSFGLNNTKPHENKSDNYGLRRDNQNMDYNPQEVLNRLKENNTGGGILKRKNTEIALESQFPDWNRLFLESNYSIGIYLKFTETCRLILRQKIVPTKITRILSSKQPITIVNQDGIKFIIYSHVWTQTELSLVEPTVYLKQHKNNATSNTLAHLYCRIHNELEERKNIWESNRYVMEKLLADRLQKNTKVPQELLIDRLCANLSCQIEYVGLHVYCEADFDKKCYTQKQNWEVVSQLRKNLTELQQLINLELPSSSFRLYERKYKSSSTPSYIIQITNPIQLICSAKNSLLTSYINRITLQKNSNQKAIHNSLSAKGLQQFIHGQIENQLLNCMNTGYDTDRRGRMFSFCGSSDYNKIMEYYNVGKDCIGSLHSIIDVEYYKQLIRSQLCSDIFTTLLKYTFHQQLPILLSQQDFHTDLVADMQEVYRQMSFLWVNSLLSYNIPSSEVLWRYLKDILNIVYGIQCENRIHNTLGGYILDFVVDKLGLKLSYMNKTNISHSVNKVNSNGVNRSRSRSRSRSKQPILRNNYQFPMSLNYAYVQANILNFIKPQQSQHSQYGSKANREYDSGGIQTIRVEMRLFEYRASRFTLLLRSLQKQLLCNLVANKLMSKQNAYVVAGGIFSLDEKKSSSRQQIIGVKEIAEQLTLNSKLPSYLQYLEPYLRLYLSQSVGLSDGKKYQHLRIYDPDYLPILSESSMCSLVPHSSTQLQVYMQIMKNLLSTASTTHYANSTATKNNIHDAIYLFNCVVEQNVFWGGQFNPYITQVYTLFSDFWVLQGDYAQAIKYYKSAMMIYMKLYPDSAFIADRHCYLADLLSSMGKYSEAVRELEYGIVKFEKFCIINGSKNDNQTDQPQEDLIKRYGSVNSQKQREDKLLMLKYIRSTIKRSRILLKSTKNTLEHSTRYYNTYSSEQIGQIIDPLYSILNQLKQTNEMVMTDNKKVSHPSLFESADSAYKSSKPCLPFIQANILKNDDLNEEVVEIFDIVVRCFALNGKFPQLTVFVGEYMLNTNIIQPVAMNLECFKKLLMILLYYQLKISSIARKSQDCIIFTQLLENLEQNGKNVRKAEAYTYIYHKYIKNIKKTSVQPYSQGFSSTQPHLFHEERARSRSPGGTSKKTQRPMIILFLKRITESLKKIQKIYKQIQKYKLIENHVPLSHGTKTEAQELIVLLEAIAALVGYDYLLALVQNDEQQYYEDGNSSRKGYRKDQFDSSSIHTVEQVTKNISFALRRY